MADPDLQIRGKGGDGQPDAEIRGTPVSKKYFFGPVWFKNKGGGWPPEPLPWIRHWFYQEAARRSYSFLQDVKKK